MPIYIKRYMQCLIPASAKRTVCKGQDLEVQWNGGN